MLVTTAVLCLGPLLASPAHGAPVDATAYGRSALRLEVRPDPTWFDGGVPMADFEGAFAGAGVGARWLSVMDPLGQPYCASEFIPTTLDRFDERERVACLHRPRSRRRGPCWNARQTLRSCDGRGKMYSRLGPHQPAHERRCGQGEYSPVER